MLIFTKMNKHKRIVAFDVGTHTIGIAQSDILQMIAHPLQTLRIDEYHWSLAITEILKLVVLQDVSTFVVGYPKMMNNTIGDSAERSQRFATLLQAHLATIEGNQANVVMYDERLTTKQAQRIMTVNKTKIHKRKQIVDTIAAVLILEDYLRYIK